MKRNNRLATILFFTLVFGLIQPSKLLADGLPVGGKVKHVVLVSVDGLAASYFDDSKAEMPTLRAIASQGARAKGMHAAFPTVTWPTHTTLVTGVHPARHGVLGNSVWDREKGRGVTYIGDPELTKDEAVKVPTLYDAVAASGGTAAGVIWPCTTGAKSLKFMIPDVGKIELFNRFTTPGFVDEAVAAGVDISKLGEWGWSKEHSNERDRLYARTASYLLTKHHINLVMVHLITPDGVEHANGPHTREAYQAVKDADLCIQEIWETLQQPAFEGNSAIFVVSDHGFAPYEKYIKPNVILKELGLVASDRDDDVKDRKAWTVTQGGSAFVYALDDEHRSQHVATMKERFQKLEGISGIVTPAEYKMFGLPDPTTNSQSPDLVLLTQPGYSFIASLEPPAITDTKGLKGSHGHDHRPDYMHATFVAAGIGIKPGVELETVRGIDVAPTIAHLMGVELKNVDGRVLDEIFTQ